MKKTPLFQEHINLKAKMASFGGFDMPIQYEGILAEHQAVRQAAGIFDTCHMGEFLFKGPGALQDLETLITRQISDMPVGRCRNSFMCNEIGGVLDDLIICRLQQEEFLMVVNAATQGADFSWIAQHISNNTSVQNLSDTMGKIDLQGPHSPKILQQLLGEGLNDFGFYHIKSFDWRGTPLLVSRTGYTGEVGFELFIEEQKVCELWQQLLTLGATPAGLGARDTLRIEMCFPLYGHELIDSRSPLQAGMNLLISDDKDFIGAEAMYNISKRQDTLAAILLDGRKSVHTDDIIYNTSGQSIGRVTSASFAPSLKQSVALGYINMSNSMFGTKVYLDINNKNLQGQIIEKPFYKHATGRKRLSHFL